MDPSILKILIAAFAIPVVISLVTRWLGAWAIGAPRSESGFMWLEHGFAIRSLGLAFPFMAGGFLVYTIQADYHWLLIVLGVVVFLVLGVFCYIETAFERIGFSDTQIRRVSPLRRERSIPWDRVTEAVFIPDSNDWLLRTTDLGKLKISAYMSGIGFLERMIRERGLVGATEPVEHLTGTGRFLYDPLPNQIILLLG